MGTSLRIVFMGTPELARTVLVALAEAPFSQLVGVAAQPDRPAGRHLLPVAPPVKAEARQRGLPVFQPERARDPEFLQQLKSLAPDLIVVAAFGQILPPSVLELPRYGCLNVHTSLLPRWRGAAPIAWAIAAGDAETGVTIMRMDAGLDTGPTLSARRTPIAAEDTGQTVHDRLAEMGGQLLVETIPPYVAGELRPVPQSAEGVTYARKLSKEDARIRWSDSAEEIARRLRAFSPWPGSFCWIPNPTKPLLLKVHAVQVGPSAPEAKPGDVIAGNRSAVWVACGQGTLGLTELQPEGGRRLTAEQFLAGRQVARLE